MGSCLTSCVPSSETARQLCNFRLLGRRQSDFTFLVEEASGLPERPTKRSFISTIFGRYKGHRPNKPMLEMVDNLINPQLSYNRLSESQRLPSTSSSMSKDIQLQFLDARALLGRTDTPDNSLDLEWEHETLPQSSLMNDSMLSKSSWSSTLRDDTLLPPNTATPLPSDGPASDSDWSRVSSSANSLEWDSVQNSVHSELDPDTQMLLNEIDRLTVRALKETGMRREIFKRHGERGGL